MNKVTVVANIHASPGRRDVVRAQLERLVPATRAEPGCLRLALHQDIGNPSHFVFHQEWDSRESWRAHPRSPRLAAWLEENRRDVPLFVVTELSPIA